MPRPRSRRPLGLVDFSVCSAIGADRASTLRALADGVSGLQPAPFALPYPAPTGVIDSLPALPARLSAYATRQARLALAVLEPLLPVLARSVARFGRERIALVLGSSNAGLDTTERHCRDYVQGARARPGYSLRTQHAFDAVLWLVQELAGIGGPAWFVSTACSSSGKAFASAERLIDAGFADAALVGGVDALCEMTLRGFRSLSVLSETPCRPFGRERSGINIGEGAALFVLDRESHAPFALLGTGESTDAHHMTAPDPEGLGAERAMRDALHAAGLEADEVDVINAHATGTPAGDVAEARALERVFGARTLVTATKGYTGHTLGASGAVEAALSLLAAEAGFAPASLGAVPRGEAIGLRISERTERTTFRHVLSNSLAFGGSNASVIFGPAP